MRYAIVAIIFFCAGIMGTLGLTKANADCGICLYPSVFSSDTVAHSQVSTDPGSPAIQIPWDYGAVGQRFGSGTYNFSGRGTVTLCVDNTGLVILC